VFWLWCDAGDLMLHGYHLSFGKWKKAMIKHEPVDLESIFRHWDLGEKDKLTMGFRNTQRWCLIVLWMDKRVQHFPSTSNEVP
jgi:hypothetical protein